MNRHTYRSSRPYKYKSFMDLLSRLEVADFSRAIFWLNFKYLSCDFSKNNER